MDPLTDNRRAEALRTAGAAVVAAIEAPERRYPAGTAFIAESHPDFAELVAGMVHDGSPFVVIASNGAETLYAPTHA